MENKRKHLEFIQSVISRMSTNSFYLRGWSITLVSALFAFANKDSNFDYIMITYISTPIFWILDGYYLSQERKYRDLYDVVRLKELKEIDFDMRINLIKKDKNSWFNCIFSMTNFIFYITLMIITLIVMFIIN